MRRRFLSPSTGVSPDNPSYIRPSALQHINLSSLHDFPNLPSHIVNNPLTPVIGMQMPGWFDISTLDKLTDSTHDDERGILSSIAGVDALIQAEINAGIPENRIIVGGFSQGGAISIMTALTSRRKLGGVVALSTWIPLSHKVPQVSTLAFPDSESGCGGLTGGRWPRRERD